MRKAMKHWTFLLTFILAFTRVKSRAIRDEEDVAHSTISPNGPVATVEFLRKFGYLEAGSSNSTETIYTKESIRQGVILMQRFGGLKETGEVDEDTVQLLTKPRCGVADIVRPSDGGGGGGSSSGSGNRNSRTKRFAIASNGWKKRTLTYSFHNWSPKLGQDAAEREMKKAFSAWAQYANLRFKRKPPNTDADISISFGRYYHGDSYPFDGKGLVLAHAYYPTGHGTYSGDIHFDDDEDWWSPDGIRRNSLPNPISFSSVAAHELGHSLGLAHSSDKDSIMFPYYNGELGKDPKLGYDDIMAVYKLYIQSYIPQDGDRDEEEKEDERPHSSTEFPRTTTTTVSTRRPTESTTEKPTRTTSTTRTPWTNTPVPTRVSLTTETTTTVTAPSTSLPKTTTTTARGTVRVTTTTDFPVRPGVLTTTTRTTAAATTTKSTSTTVRNSVDAGEHGGSGSGGTTPREHDAGVQRSAERDLCSGLPVKIAFLRNEIFVFRGQYMWRLADIGSPPPPAYPVKIGNFFRSLESVDRIDAAYERNTDGHFVFFAGNRYWEMDGTLGVNGSPKALTSLGLPTSISKLDAAFVWGKNGLTYFFSGNLYWRYNETSKQMDQGYPQGMEKWQGIPSPIDSVLRYSNGKTYFFRGDDFWRFDDIMVKAEENFPLSVKDYWLGC